MCYSFVMALWPPPPIVLCRCDRVFGTTPASFTVVLCKKKVLLLQVLLNARSPQQPDSGTRVTASFPDQQDCQSSHERWWHILLGPITAQPVWSWWTPTFKPVILPLSSKIYHLPFTHQMCIHVWMWVSTQVSKAFMRTSFVCKWECARSPCVFLTLLVQTADSYCLNLFGCQLLFFLS